MSVVIDDLLPSATYCCALVKTVSGKTYSEEHTFTTEADILGVGSVDATAPAITGYYDMTGRRLDVSAKGINIILYSDGTTRKVIVK